MTTMVRKQIYIESRQDALLKRLARVRKTSEAELIRQAIDRQLGTGLGHELPSDSDAWEQAHQFMLELLARGPIEGKGRTWKREDLYEERLSRYGRDTD